MLVRDVRTGLLMAVPDNRFSAVPYGAYGLGSFVPRATMYAPGLGYAASPMHHGLGDPVGLPFLAALAPLASSLLPAIAGGVSSLLPSIGKVASSLPGVISEAAKAIPSIAQSAMATAAPAVAPPPAAPAPDGAAALPPPPPVAALPPPPPPLLPPDDEPDDEGGLTTGRTICSSHFALQAWQEYRRSASPVESVVAGTMMW